MKARVAALVAMAAATAASLGPAIAAGRFWAAGDGLTQNFGQRVATAEALRAFEIPFWNPWIFGGMPLYATIQPGTFFPGNWAFLLLPPTYAQDATVALAVVGAMVTTALFARALALPWAAALLAGLAYGLGGFVTMHVEHVQMAQIAALIPLLLWCVERFAQDRRMRHATGAALVAAGMVLAGSPQITAYGLMLGAAYAAFRGLALPAAERLGFFAAGAAAGAVGVGLAACQLLPTLDLIAGTQRGSLGPYAFTFDSLPPQGLLGLVAPYAFGVRAPAWPLTTPWWGVPAWQGFLDGYVGLTALVLAAIALFRLRVDRQVRFWAAVALLGTLLALGAFTPLQHVVAQLPVLNGMRYPYRHFVYVTLALALLAAHGLAWLMAADPADPAARRARRLTGGLFVAGGAALPLGAAVFGAFLAARLQPHMPKGVDLAAALVPQAPGLWLPLAIAAAAAALVAALPRRPLAAWALAALVAGDLLLYGQVQGLAFVLPLRPAGPVTAPWPDPAAGRELTVPEARYPNCYGCDVLAHLQRFRYPGAAALAGLATVNGYDAFLPARYGVLLGMDSFGHAGERDPALWGPAHHALDLVGCRTVRLEAAVAAEPGWGDRLAGGRFDRRPDADGFVVLANPRALPPGWRVASARAVDAAAADAAVAGKTPFDPRREALLEGSDAPTGAFAAGPVATRWIDRTRLVAATDGPGPGLVVLSEGFDPGWTAQLVAGPGAPRALPVHRADALLMAVAVPAGPCEVALTYRPRRWGLGLAITGLAALLGLAGLLAWARARRGPAARV